MSMQWIGLKELQAAIKRNPRTVQDEGRKFLVRGLALLKGSIIRNPWTMQSSGGGAPKRTGNLRDTHMTEISGLSGWVGPNQHLAPYARFVHNGTKRMRGRPWLEYARSTQSGAIEGQYRVMLGAITKDLAR